MKASWREEIATIDSNEVGGFSAVCSDSFAHYRLRCELAALTYGLGLRTGGRELPGLEA